MLTERELQYKISNRLKNTQVTLEHILIVLQHFIIHNASLKGSIPPWGYDADPLGFIGDFEICKVLLLKYILLHR